MFRWESDTKYFFLQFNPEQFEESINDIRQGAQQPNLRNITVLENLQSTPF